MSLGYTEEAEERFYSLMDEAMDVEMMDFSDYSDLNAWIETLKSIGRDFCFSARFVLLRMYGEECGIEKVTARYAENMSENDWKKMERFLLEEKASLQKGNEKEKSKIIHKAIFPEENGRIMLLDRKEALYLGHTLQFSIEEMEFFLLRVLDGEDGFFFNRSEDVIEMFGFLNNLSAEETESYKEEYKKRYGSISKVEFDDKEENMTREMGQTLLGESAKLESIIDPKEKKNEFINWLGEMAQYLDIPSKTAMRIYRNLAVYGYCLAGRVKDMPDTSGSKYLSSQLITEFKSTIEELIENEDYTLEVKEYLLKPNDIRDAAEEIVHVLLRENKWISGTEEADLTKPWNVIQMVSGGRISIVGRSTDRDRVRKILCGELETIQKSDMMYLLWFIANLCWEASEGLVISPDEICNRILDFKDLSEKILEESMLPSFYIPHLMEQSMLLSMIYANHYQDKTPSEIYELIRQSLKRKRRKKGEC